MTHTHTYRHTNVLTVNIVKYQTAMCSLSHALVHLPKTGCTGDTYVYERQTQTLRGRDTGRGRYVVVTRQNYTSSLRNVMTCLSTARDDCCPRPDAPLIVYTTQYLFI